VSLLTAEIAGRYLAGETGGELAAFYGMTRQGIYNHLDRAGVERRRFRKRDRAEEIVAAYTSPERPSCNELARRFGISPLTVSRILRDHGIPTRSKVEQVRLYHSRCRGVKQP
jgi:transcriptional regulator with XRE-family HTH domain